MTTVKQEQPCEPPLAPPPMPNFVPQFSFPGLGPAQLAHGPGGAMDFGIPPGMPPMGMLPGLGPFPGLPPNFNPANLPDGLRPPKPEGMPMDGGMPPHPHGHGEQHHHHHHQPPPRDSDPSRIITPELQLSQFLGVQPGQHQQNQPLINSVELEVINKQVDDFCYDFLSNLGLSDDEGVGRLGKRKKMGYSNESKPSKKKKRRSKLPPDALVVLREWFLTHMKDPYPKDDAKLDLAKQTGLTVKQVNTWFTNTRKRVWQPFLAEAKAKSEREVAIRRLQDHRKPEDVLSSLELEAPDIAPRR